MNGKKLLTITVPCCLSTVTAIWSFSTKSFFTYSQSGSRLVGSPSTYWMRTAFLAMVRVTKWPSALICCTPVKANARTTINNRLLILRYDRI